jgi:hypothetical protein
VVKSSEPGGFWLYKPISQTDWYGLQTFLTLEYQYHALTFVVTPFEIGIYVEISGRNGLI